MSDKFPNDRTGEVLRRMREVGADFSKLHEIEFHVDVRSAEGAEQIALEARKIGYRTHVTKDDDAPSWTVVCSCDMLLDHAQITDAEETLDRLAHPFGGRSDGWGAYAVR